METHSFIVKGMHCASCSQLIKKRLSKLSGVESCEVNYATEKAKIAYDDSVISLENMNRELEKLGYSIAPNVSEVHEKIKHTNLPEADHLEHLGLSQSKEEKLHELQREKQTVVVAMSFAVLVIIAMIWNSIIPISMQLFNTFSFILASIVLFWIGRPFLEGVEKFVKYRVANMDTLIGIGTLTAYLFSALIFLFPQVHAFFKTSDSTYFDVVIVVIAFVKLGKYLESRSKLKTGEAIEKLLSLQVKTAIVRRGNAEVKVPLEEVQVGDLLIVKPGSKVPVDGVIVEGASSIDESMMSGESLPVDKKIGDTVIGSTINKQGHFIFKATKVGSETVLAQIIRLVENAQGSQAPIQGLADSVSAVFVPVVLGIAILTFLVWLVVGSLFLGTTTALSYAITCFVGILVIACPCALGLATPTAIIVGVGKGAENGILIKNAESLERLKAVTTVVMDKTRTITIGKPVLTDSFILDKTITKQELLQKTASIEKKSEHPLSEALVAAAQAQNLALSPVSHFKITEGIGVEGTIADEHVSIHKPTDREQIAEISKFQSEGKTVIVVEVNHKLVGIFAISDTLKPESKNAIAKLRKQNISVIMLTGDNEKAAQYIAKQAGVDSVIADVLPQDKAKKIQELQALGNSVAMVGDGINDAPALTQADVGIAMATGTDVAIESADVVLLHGDLNKAVQAIILSKATVRTIKQNLFWAFIYNLIGIPLAAGLLYPFTGILLSPIFAGIAMAGSSVSVVFNSLRLRFFNLH
ncbi:cadmium-translocating P-type ATPase [Candidatus Roizmanbacteria bacterium]|nr:cadmium-translocating P-type ATPase [Candidatus Roizmanbacteria bacterium]